MASTFQHAYEMLGIGCVAEIANRTFLRSKVVLDPSKFNGACEAWFEIDAKVGNAAAVDVLLVDAYDPEEAVEIARITVPASTSAATRLRASSPIAWPAVETAYYLRLLARGADQNVTVYNCRLVINQTYSSRSRIQIPLAMSRGIETGSGADNYSHGALMNQNNSLVYQLDIDRPGAASWCTLPFLKDSSLYDAVIEQWELEVIAGGPELDYHNINATLWNTTDDVQVAASEIDYLGGGVTERYTRAFADDAANFDDGDTFDLKIHSYTGSSQYMYLQRAALYIDLRSIRRVTTYRWVNGNGNTALGQNAVVSKPILYEADRYVDPTIDFLAYSKELSAGTVKVGLREIAADTGSTGSDVAGVAFDPGGAWAMAIATGITLTDEKRYLLSTSAGTGSVYVKGSVLRITSERVVGGVTGIAPYGFLPVLKLTIAGVAHYISSFDVCHPDWFAASKVTNWGSLSRALPQVPGFPVGSDFEVTIDDTDGEFLALRTAGSLRGAAVELYLGPFDGSWAIDFTRIFLGEVWRASGENNECKLVIHDKRTLALQSALDSGLNTDDFPNLPVSDWKGLTRKPIIYGLFSGAGGRVECPYVDTLHYRYLVARHPVDNIAGVYERGDLVDPAYYNIVEEEIGGDTCTLIDFVTPRLEDGAHISITTEVMGKKLAGAAIENPADYIYDYLIDYMGAVDGDFDTVSMGAVNDALAALGWTGPISIRSETTHEEVIARILTSYNIDLYNTVNGLIGFAFFDPNAVSSLTLTESDIGRESLTHEDLEDIANRINYQYRPDPAMEEFLGHGKYDDDTSQTELGEVVAQEMKLWYVTDAAMAAEIAARRLALLKPSALKVEFNLASPEFLGQIELGQMISIDHPLYPGAASDRLRVTALNYDLNNLVLIATAIQITDRRFWVLGASLLGINTNLGY